MIDREWQKMLDQLNTNLRHAEAGLRSAVTNGSASWIKTAQNAVEQANAAIRDHEEQK